MGECCLSLSSVGHEKSSAGMGFLGIHLNRYKAIQHKTRSNTIRSWPLRLAVIGEGDCMKLSEC